jgi:putative hydrolase of the HAD superfamily
VKEAVLFDLGGTLAAYYGRSEFPGILRQSLDAVTAMLSSSAATLPDADEVWRRAEIEGHEAPDYHVIPLAERLRRVFGLAPGEGAMDEALCRAFLGPIFACAHVYDDSLPVLRQLRDRGLRLAIVTNTPWGSPADLWREEIARLGLAAAVDDVVCCTDAGWRKPDPRPFHLALARLGAAPDEALFVGDDPRWDTAGAAAAGIDALLIDRTSGSARAGCITGLAAVFAAVTEAGAERR